MKHELTDREIRTLNVFAETSPFDMMEICDAYIRLGKSYDKLEVVLQDSCYLNLRIQDLVPLFDK